MKLDEEIKETERICENKSNLITMKIHRLKVVNSTLLWLGMVQCEMDRHLFCEYVLVNVGKCFGY